MTDEKRFPPPGDEVGYREAAPLATVDTPAPLEAGGTKKHVIATLAEPPEIARGHAVVESDGLHEVKLAGRAAAIQRNRRIALITLLFLATAFGAIAVVSWILRTRNERRIAAVRDADQAELARRHLRVACDGDGDCTNSCSQGAVSRQWLEGYTGPECNDGCTGQLALPPRCIRGECVAFQADPRTGVPRRNDWCTKIK
jgi:hypothetical protein